MSYLRQRLPRFVTLVGYVCLKYNVNWFHALSISNFTSDSLIVSINIGILHLMKINYRSLSYCFTLIIIYLNNFYDRSQSSLCNRPTLVRTLTHFKHIKEIIYLFLITFLV